MSGVVNFEIHATEPDKLVEFYSKSFGWSFQRWEGPIEYWLITTNSDEGIRGGGLVRRRGPAAPSGSPVNAFICTIRTDSLDVTQSKILAAGGTQAVPKMPIPGIGWLAYFHDPDGNLFGVMQNDPAAA